MARTEQELTTLTAKALRPIAAELGITGTSRMVKADIIAAIIAAEAALEIGAAVDAVHGPTRADFLMSLDWDAAQARRVEDAHAEALVMDEKRTMARAFLSTPSGARLTDDEIEAALQARKGANERLLELAATPLQQTPRNMPYGGHWAMSFPLARGGDGNVMQGHVDYCAAWGHATDTRDGVVMPWCPRCGDLLSAEQIEAKREELRNRMVAEVDAQIPAVLCDHGIDARRRCSICVEDTAPKTIDGRGALLERGRAAGLSEFDLLSDTEDLRVLVDRAEARAERAAEVFAEIAAENTPAPEYFARATRRGVETVVVERAHCGRVDYRIIDAKTGRRSSVYRMRELTFRAQYVKVPS